MKFRCVWILSASVVLALSSCTTTQPSSSVESPPETVSFADDIRPILAETCVNCHNVQTMPDRPSFESRELAMDSSKGGAIIVPGHPESSRVMHAVKSPDIAERAMPPVGHRVSAEQVALLGRWIAEGAHWPGGAAGRIRPTAIPQE